MGIKGYGMLKCKRLMEGMAEDTNKANWGHSKKGLNVYQAV